MTTRKVSHDAKRIASAVKLKRLNREPIISRGGLRRLGIVVAWVLFGRLCYIGLDATLGEHVFGPFAHSVVNVFRPAPTGANSDRLYPAN